MFVHHMYDKCQDLLMIIVDLHGYVFSILNLRFLTCLRIFLHILVINFTLTLNVYVQIMMGNIFLMNSKSSCKQNVLFFSVHVLICLNKMDLLSRRIDIYLMSPTHFFFKLLPHLSFELNPCPQWYT